MNKYTIIWSPIAKNDFQNIYNYIKNTLNSKELANNTIQKLLKSINKLCYFPEKYIKIASSFHKYKNIRKMPVNKYVIIYEVNVVLRTSFYLTYFS